MSLLTCLTTQLVPKLQHLLAAACSARQRALHYQPFSSFMLEVHKRERESERQTLFILGTNKRPGLAVMVAVAAPK